MTDKLKIMQILPIEDEVCGDAFCVSIGYPDLQLPANASGNAHAVSDEQPILDDNPFDGYISKAEFEDLVLQQG